jgi:hypothetical protein
MIGDDLPPTDVVARWRALLGSKAFDDMLTRLIRNSYRPDIHFLPHDGQPREWSGIPEHSVAMFRYPITIPIELLDRSQLVKPEQWEAEASRLVSVFPCSRACAGRRPMKRVRLRPRFFSDLLSRYIAIYARVGAPDFTAETVETYTRTIMEV